MQYSKSNNNFGCHEIGSTGASGFGASGFGTAGVSCFGQVSVNAVRALRVGLSFVVCASSGVSCLISSFGVSRISAGVSFGVSVNVAIACHVFCSCVSVGISGVLGVTNVSVLDSASSVVVVNNGGVWGVSVNNPSGVSCLTSSVLWGTPLPGVIIHSDTTSGTADKRTKQAKQATKQGLWE